MFLEQVALKLGLGWLDVKFDSRVTQALEVQGDIEILEQQDIVEGARQAGRILGLTAIGKVFPLAFLVVKLMRGL